MLALAIRAPHPAGVPRPRGSPRNSLPVTRGALRPVATRCWLSAVAGPFGPIPCGQDHVAALHRVPAPRPSPNPPAHALQALSSLALPLPTVTSAPRIFQLAKHPRELVEGGGARAPCQAASWGCRSASWPVARLAAAAALSSASPRAAGRSGPGQSRRSEGGPLVLWLCSWVRSAASALSAPQAARAKGQQLNDLGQSGSKQNVGPILEPHESPQLAPFASCVPESRPMYQRVGLRQGRTGHHSTCHDDHGALLRCQWLLLASTGGHVFGEPPC